MSAVNVPFEIKGWRDREADYRKVDYLCNAWTEEDIIPKSEALPCDIFYIRFCLREVPWSCNLMQECDDDDEQIPEELLGPIKAKSFWMTRTSLLNHDLEAKTDVYDGLQSVGVPEWIAFAMIEEVACFARKIVKVPRNAALEVLPIVFAVAVQKVESDEA